MAARISNQSGQSLVLGLALLPICVLMISGFIWLSEFIFLQDNQKEICRIQVLNQMDFASSSLNQLLDLNKAVIALRLEHATVLSAIAAANASLQYHVVAGLVAQLQAIEAQQRIVSVAQKKIVFGFNLQSVSKMLEGNSKLRNTLQKFQIMKTTSLIFPNWILQLPAKRTDELDPAIYQADAELVRSFKAEYIWQIQLLQDLPLLSATTRTWHSSCSATIKERNGKWSKNLNWVKP